MRSSSASDWNQTALASSDSSLRSWEIRGSTTPDSTADSLSAPPQNLSDTPPTAYANQAKL